MEHGVIAQHQRRHDPGGGEQGVDLGLGEGLGQAVTGPGRVNAGQRAVDQPPLGNEKGAVGAQGGQPARIGAGADAPLMAVPEELLDLRAADALGPRPAGIGQETVKGFQVGPVGGHGVGGQPALDGQILQEKMQVVGVVGEVQGRAGSGAKVGQKYAPTARPSGRSVHIRDLIRLNFRSLRRASAALRRFFTLGFS